MPNWLTKFFKPLITISNRPLAFMAWLFALLLFGLSPLWIALLKGYLLGSSLCAWFIYLTNKGLMSFSIVVLANGLANAAHAKDSGSTEDFAAIRSITFVVSIFVLLINSIFIAIDINNGASNRGFHLQIGLFLISLVIAIYLYCFKDSAWEKSVDFVRKEDDSAAEQLTVGAAQVTKDKKGVKL